MGYNQKEGKLKIKGRLGVADGAKSLKKQERVRVGTQTEGLILSWKKIPFD